MQPHKQKKFATLRAWNRKRNYFFKSLRMTIARWRWDRRSRQTFIVPAAGKILLLRNDGKIGDMIVSTSLMRGLYQNGFTVDILATESNAVVIKHNPYIRKIHIDNGSGETAALAAEHYDLVIDMGDKISPASLLFLRQINAQNVVGFNKEQYNIYNKSITFSGFQQHITERYALLMQELKLNSHDTAYNLFYPEEIAQETAVFLKNLPQQKNIVVNPFAADSKRELSATQLSDLFIHLRAQFPDYNVIYFDPENRIRIEVPTGVYKNPQPSLFSAIALIAHSDLVITPDTSIVHIAATYRKPLIALYGNELHGQYQNNKTWGPGYPAAIQLFTRDKYHPVSTIDATEIIDQARIILHQA